MHSIHAVKKRERDNQVFLSCLVRHVCGVECVLLDARGP